MVRPGVADSKFIVPRTMQTADSRVAQMTRPTLVGGVETPSRSPARAALLRPSGVILYHSLCVAHPIKAH